MSDDSKNYKSFILGAVGCFLLVFGITLILIFWNDVVSFFKGISGIILAISGLGIIYFLQKK